MIGLFGGAFDPVHFGHLRTALEVMESLSLEEIRFIPVNRPPHKQQPVLSAEKRTAMVARAIQRQPGFTIDRCELERGGVSYTVDTLQEMRDRYGQQQPLVILLGTDAFAGLPKWHRWEEILQQAHIAIMSRPGGQIDSREFPPGYLDEALTTDIGLLKRLAGGKVLQVNVTPLDISSSRIRSLIQSGRSIRYLMPEAEADYLLQNEYYT